MAADADLSRVDDDGQAVGRRPGGADAGVPTVDTLVAQHLLKTVTAIRLMGADCIISGIRPQIAQTIVHLSLHQDGDDLIREVRRNEATRPVPQPHLPAIALTSFTREQDRAQASARSYARSMAVGAAVIAATASLARTRWSATC